MKGLNIPEQLHSRRLTHFFEDDFDGIAAAPKSLTIPPTSWRVWDAFQTNLPGTAAADDLAIVGGTFGTAGQTIQGVDFGGTSTTAYARAQVRLPNDYVAGQPVTLALRAGMVTSIADTSCTVDVEAYKVTDGAIGSDLVSTSAKSINSLTIGEKNFVITPTGLSPGDVLDVRIKITGTDGANAAVMLPTITKIELLYSGQVGPYAVAGTLTVNASRNGVRTLSTDAVANAEAFLFPIDKSLKFAADVPVFFRAAVSFTDADGSNGIVAIGFTDQAGAGLVQDGGLLLKSGAQYGALFVKKLGNAFWSCMSSGGSAGTTQQDVSLNTTDRNNLTRQLNGPSATQQMLEMEVLPTNNRLEIVFRIDGVVVAKHDSIDITNATAMRPVLFVKAGTGTAQALIVDFWQWAQKR